MEVDMRRIFNICDNSNVSNTFLTLQNLREDIIGELDAIIQYNNHLMQTNDSNVQENIKDIILEEEIHVGQLFGLLFRLSPETKVQFMKGMDESEK